MLNRTCKDILNALDRLVYRNRSPGRPPGAGGLFRTLCPGGCRLSRGGTRRGALCDFRGRHGLRPERHAAGGDVRAEVSDRLRHRLLGQNRGAGGHHLFAHRLLHIPLARNEGAVVRAVSGNALQPAVPHLRRGTAHRFGNDHQCAQPGDRGEFLHLFSEAAADVHDLRRRDYHLLVHSGHSDRSGDDLHLAGRSGFAAADGYFSGVAGLSGIRDHHRICPAQSLVEFGNRPHHDGSDSGREFPQSL